MFDEVFLHRWAPGHATRYWQNMALLFMALYVGAASAMTWEEWRTSKHAWQRRCALRGRARAVVHFDRIINGQFERGESMYV